MSGQWSVVSSQWSVVRGQRSGPLRHSSFIIHHSSLPSARRGISLLEILIATFVLAIGLLGLAALLPVGRFAIVETGKADRAGACGRAALRDVNVRRMLDYTTWSPPIGGGVTDVSPFVIDPLGYASTITVNLGGATGPISRMTLLSPATGIQYTLAEAEQVFTWQDDLVFDMPEDVTMRPSIMTTGLDSQGDYSWFLTVTPAAELWPGGRAAINN